MKAIAMIVVILALTACEKRGEREQLVWKEENKTEVIAEVGQCSGGGYSAWDGSHPGKAAVKFVSGKFATLQCPVMVGMPIDFERAVKYVAGTGAVVYEGDWKRKR